MSERQLPPQKTRYFPPINRNEIYLGIPTRASEKLNNGFQLMTLKSPSFWGGQWNMPKERAKVKGIVGSNWYKSFPFYRNGEYQVDGRHLSSFVVEEWQGLYEWTQKTIEKSIFPIGAVHQILSSREYSFLLGTTISDDPENPWDDELVFYIARNKSGFNKDFAVRGIIGNGVESSYFQYEALFSDDLKVWLSVYRDDLNINKNIGSGSIIKKTKEFMALFSPEMIVDKNERSDLMYIPTQERYVQETLF